MHLKMCAISFNCATKLVAAKLVQKRKTVE